MVIYNIYVICNSFVIFSQKMRFRSMTLALINSIILFFDPYFLYLFYRKSQGQDEILNNKKVIFAATFIFADSRLTPCLKYRIQACIRLADQHGLAFFAQFSAKHARAYIYTECIIKDKLIFTENKSL